MGVSYSKCGSRPCPAHIDLRGLQHLHGASGYATRNVAPALALRTFVLKVCNSYTDRGRVLLEMWFSPWRRAHSFKHVQQFHGSRPAPVQNVALALAPRTFVFKHLQQVHGSRACVTQNVALALAPRTLVFV